MTSTNEGASPADDSKPNHEDGAPLATGKLYKVRAPADFRAVSLAGKVRVRFTVGGEAFDVGFGVAEARELSDFMLRAWASTDRGTEAQAAEAFARGLDREPPKGGAWPHADVFCCYPVDLGRVMVGLALPSVTDRDGGVLRLLLGGDVRALSGTVLRAAAEAHVSVHGVEDSPEVATPENNLGAPRGLEALGEDDASG